MANSTRHLLMLCHHLASPGSRRPFDWVAQPCQAASLCVSLWPLPDIDKPWGFGPVFDPAPWAVAETSVNVNNEHWALDVGSVNHRIRLV